MRVAPAQLAVFFLGASVCLLGILLLLLQKEGPGGAAVAAASGEARLLVDDAESAGRLTWEEGRGSSADGRNDASVPPSALVAPATNPSVSDGSAALSSASVHSRKPGTPCACRAARACV